LFGGGAERVATELANHWTTAGRNVSLITIDAIHGERYPLDERVQKIGLGLFRDSSSLATRIWNNRLRVSGLRQAIRTAGASQVVSFTDITNVTTLLACRRLSVEVIVCERTDPRSHRLGRVWSTLRSQTYGRAAAIVVQTHGVASWAEAQNWQRPIYVIPNAAPASKSTVAEPRLDRIRQSVVALGRLSPEKGFDLLIEAFARVAAKYPTWELRIAGDGVERNNLTALVQRLGMQDRIVFEGWNAQSELILQRSDVFALPSRYEGFPNALLEAMAAGLACVSFDCDSGPRDIIRAGTDGLLVAHEDVAQLAAALDELMSDAPLRRRLGERAREVSERFSRERIFRLWDAVLQKMPSEEFKLL
jgi:glycosyltransferase involved in cell wall biosynthesis